VLTIWDRFQRGHGISLLVPFRCPDQASVRAMNWRWLERYWRAQLPGAEIVMGQDSIASASGCLEPPVPFSKCCAVNDAASRAKGDIFVIVDADGYVSASAVLFCAQKIRHALKIGRRRWFVPYRHFYRLTEKAAAQVLESDPAHPYILPDPPATSDLQETTDTGVAMGHWYGAMIQIVPRQAFEEVGGWDQRFRGWGGEDVAAMRATDTLYWRHSTIPASVFHLWHPMLGSHSPIANYVDCNHRVWENQIRAGVNGRLATRYYAAHGDRKRMRALVDEGKEIR
jgi:hypothetical protein